LVETLLREANAKPSWLRLEITESVIMAEPERAIDTLGQLRKLGVHLAVDDFGTGYSSLAYLHRLPVDEIKIDKSFVSKLAGATSRANIVRASVDLGHSLRLESVAEGVEDARTWDLLAALGCDTAQGFYMGRPMAAEEILPWLRRWEASEAAGLNSAAA
jgi:EAL domain-containing protein (putative c-di-GMP-specific phosphodiesterase class I)